MEIDMKDNLKKIILMDLDNIIIKIFYITKDYIKMVIKMDKEHYFMKMEINIKGNLN
jgi:hypothetical protein